MGELYRNHLADQRQQGPWRDQPPYPAKLELLRNLRLEQDGDCDETELQKLTAGQVHDEIQQRLNDDPQ